jgi:hypothetical protein
MHRGARTCSAHTRSPVRRGNEVDPGPGLRKRAPLLPAKVEVLKTHIRMAQPIRLTIYGLRS